MTSGLYKKETVVEPFPEPVLQTQHALGKMVAYRLRANTQVLCDGVYVQLEIEFHLHDFFPLTAQPLDLGLDHRLALVLDDFHVFEDTQDLRSRRNAPVPILLRAGLSLQEPGAAMAGKVIKKGKQVIGALDLAVVGKKRQKGILRQLLCGRYILYFTKEIVIDADIVMTEEVSKGRWAAVAEGNKLAGKVSFSGHEQLVLGLNGHSNIIGTRCRK